MAAILIYSENSALALELLTAAQFLAQEKALEVKAVCINNETQVAELVSRGAATYHIKNENLNVADTAAMAAALEQAVKELDASIVILASNRRGKELAGRLAQKIEAGCLTDVSGLTVVDGKVQCRRNALSGAVIATQQIESEKQVIALAPRSFEAAPEAQGGNSQSLETQAAATIKLIDSRSKAGDMVDISAAEILVIVGQGIEQENLKSAEKIAQALGAEIACSKPLATDKKWFPEDRIIGLSGKICKPQLALILGISGQVQFTVGIREAGTIVAVNNDENADMLQMADYYMIADLKDILPDLEQALG